MSLVIRLKDVSFSNESLPTIGDYGKIYTDEILGLYKLESGDYLADSSTNQAQLEYTGNATGALSASYADGVFSFPDPESAGEVHRLKVGSTAAGLPFTFVVAYRKDSARTCYLLQSDPFTGVSLVMGSKLSIYSASTGAKAMTTDIAVGDWNIIVATIDSDGVRINRNGIKEGELLFASNGGVPSAGTRSHYLGAESVGQGFQGDVAFIATYDRSMTDAEMASTARGVANFLRNKKGIII